MLYDDFRKEKMEALKNKDKLKNKVITNILSDLIYIKKELGIEPTEEDSTRAVSKQIKQLKESMEFAKDRPETLEEIKKELEILQSYLPKQLSEEEIKAEVEKIMTSQAIEPSVKNKGIVMKTVMAELKGKADGKLISQVVADLLK